MFGGEWSPHAHTHTHRGWGRQGGGRHLHAHKTIPICLRRQTPLLGFLGSRSCTNMWKRNVSLLSAGHTCNSIYCSHVQEIHQTGPISSRGETQSIRDRGKPTLNSIPYFTLIGLDSGRGVGGHAGLLGCRCSRAHRAGKPPLPPSSRWCLPVARNRGPTWPRHHLCRERQEAAGPRGALPASPSTSAAHLLPPRPGSGPAGGGGRKTSWTCT